MNRALRGPAAATEVVPVRVLVAEGSPAIRGLYCRWLEEDGAIAVVGRPDSAAAALRQAAECRPDVVLLDAGMADSALALPELLRIDRGPTVLIASDLTRRDAEISLRALADGAADYVAKPSAAGEAAGPLDLRRDLLGKVKALAAARRMRPRGGGGAMRGVAAARPMRLARRPEGGLYGQAPITLRRGARTPPKVIGIGSSTGGPQALTALLGHLAGTVRQPILVSQHMPAAFTPALAAHLCRAAGASCAEGRDGEPLRPGRVYLAPGDYHMTVQRRGRGPAIALDQEPPENFSRPAVDPMLRSLAELFGPAVLGVVLTGIGHDGLIGAHAVVAAGGTMLAQDEATSLVWGMPGAVATGGLCCAVLPLAEIGPTVARIAAGVAA